MSRPVWNACTSRGFTARCAEGRTWVRWPGSPLCVCVFWWQERKKKKKTNAVNNYKRDFDCVFTVQRSEPFFFSLTLYEVQKNVTAD